MTRPTKERWTPNHALPHIRSLVDINLSIRPNQAPSHSINMNPMPLMTYYSNNYRTPLPDNYPTRNTYSHDLTLSGMFSNYSSRSFQNNLANCGPMRISYKIGGQRRTAPYQSRTQFVNASGFGAELMEANGNSNNAVANIKQTKDHQLDLCCEIKNLRLAPALLSPPDFQHLKSNDCGQQLPTMSEESLQVKDRQLDSCTKIEKI